MDDRSTDQTKITDLQLTDQKILIFAEKNDAQPTQKLVDLPTHRQSGGVRDVKV